MHELDRPARLLAAAWLSGTRLIDNVKVQLSDLTRLAFGRDAVATSVAFESCWIVSSGRVSCGNGSV
jgi:hypothetical protein